MLPEPLETASSEKIPVYLVISDAAFYLLKPDSFRVEEEKYGLEPDFILGGIAGRKFEDVWNYWSGECADKHLFKPQDGTLGDQWKDGWEPVFADLLRLLNEIPERAVWTTRRGWDTHGYVFSTPNQFSIQKTLITYMEWPPL